MLILITIVPFDNLAYKSNSIVMNIYLINIYFDENQELTAQFIIQCSSFTTLCLCFIGMDHVISELCYTKGTILQRNYRKMTIFHGHFPIIPS